jgi:hypothetical protein
MVTAVAGATTMLMDVRLALPVFVESSVDVAVIVAVPDCSGVNTPADVIDPMDDGLTDQVTALLKLPVPVTVADAVAVCVVVMVVGDTATVTPVIVG